MSGLGLRVVWVEQGDGIISDGLHEDIKDHLGTAFSHLGNVRHQLEVLGGSIAPFTCETTKMVEKKLL